jgi:hypothetical protein
LLLWEEGCRQQAAFMLLRMLLLRRRLRVEGVGILGDGCCCCYGRCEDDGGVVVVVCRVVVQLPMLDTSMCDLSRVMERLVFGFEVMM